MIKKMKEVSQIISEWVIYGGIDEFNPFSELIEALYSAQEGDYMLWKLNSPGGACDVGEALINAMRLSRAYVHCHVESNCYSMASMLALCGDGLSFNKNTYLMFHDYNTMYHGKGSEIVKHTDLEREMMHKMLQDWCCPFLTQKEFNSMMEGRDLYIRWDQKDLPARVKRHFKYSPEESK
jgi:ATP-dependent protease ClpP protease subunit